LHFWIAESWRVGSKVKQKRVIGLGHVSLSPETALESRLAFWQNAAFRLQQLGDDGRLARRLAQYVPLPTRDEFQAIRDLVCGAKNRVVVT
jgi:hypothetical protein